MIISIDNEISSVCLKKYYPPKLIIFDLIETVAGGDAQVDESPNGDGVIMS